MTLTELLVLAMGLARGLETQLAPVADFLGLLAHIPERALVAWQEWSIARILGQ